MSHPSSRLLFGLIPWYGFLIVLGIVLAVFISGREAKRLNLPEDTILDLALLVLPIGILGARIYYVLFSLPFFLENPIRIFYIWEGGLAIYGGLIFGFVTILLFCRRRKIPVLMMLDLLVPGVVLAQSLGRWGNYFNQEAYGFPLAPDSVFAFFPLAVRISSESGLVWHAATFFYESLWDFCIFIFLLWGRRRYFRRQGDVFLFYLLLYGSGRLLIEHCRMDSLYLGSSIRISQLFSVLLTLVVYSVFAFRVFSRPRQKLFLPVLVTCCTLVMGILVIGFCFSTGFIGELSLKQQLLFLSFYSFLIILSSLLLYHCFSEEDVVYANHPAD